MTARERFESKINKKENCWIWTGYIGPHGYGKFSLNKKFFRAHRFSYELYISKIPQGLMVCHKCDVRSCVNPNHLFVGTQKDNIRDMINKGKFRNVTTEKNASKTHCKNRHPLSGTNLIFNRNGTRKCRACKRL